MSLENDSSLWLAKEHFQQFIDLLWSQGYRVIGPRIDQSAIIYDEVRQTTDLPVGWTQQQSPGRYQVLRRDDQQWFGFNVGPHSWKQFLFPPHAVLVEVQRIEAGWEMSEPNRCLPKYAFLGVRACELAAIALQDQIFKQQQYVDPVYAQLREQALIIAVNCTGASSTCFCSSLETGPTCRQGFDMALSELEDGFTVEVGSQLAATLLETLPTNVTTAQQQLAAAAAREQASKEMTKQLDTTNLHDLLLDNLDHPHWDQVAERCLSCTNCTMVCPTCFCSSVSEVGDLLGDKVQRVRQWDSCFNLQFSYMNGGLVRNDVRARYRQWLTHKLATWIDQFGSSGCVGCGRCISWCPVGIDLTEEVAALREKVG